MENINTIYANLPTTIPAYIVENSDMSYTIVLNARLSSGKKHYFLLSRDKTYTSKRF